MVEGGALVKPPQPALCYDSEQSGAYHATAETFCIFWADFRRAAMGLLVSPIHPLPHGLNQPWGFARRVVSSTFFLWPRGIGLAVSELCVTRFLGSKVTGFHDLGALL